MPTELIPTAVSVAGGLLSSGGGSTQPGIPADLRGTRANQIDLLNYFLGFGGPAQGGGSRAGGGGAGGQWPFNGGGAGIPGAPGGLDRGRGGGGFLLPDDRRGGG